MPPKHNAQWAFVQGATGDRGAGYAVTGMGCTVAWCFAGGYKGRGGDFISSRRESGPDGDTQAVIWTVANRARPILQEQTLPGARQSISAIGCASQGYCVALGQRRSGGISEVVSWTFDGHRWSKSPQLVPAPAPPGAAPFIRSVSCPRAGVCTAVGGISVPASPRAPSETTFPLVEQLRNGRWGPLANPPGVSGSTLELVICSSSPSCFLAGWALSQPPGGDGFANGGGYEGSISGSGWVVSNAGDPSGWWGGACTDPQQCLTVGARYDENMNQQAELRWRGNGQEFSKSIANEFTGGILSASTCLRPHFCIVVGNSYERVGKPAMQLRPLAYGISVDHPTEPVSLLAPAMPRGALTAVACFDARRCLLGGMSQATTASLTGPSKPMFLIGNPQKS